MEQNSYGRSGDERAAVSRSLASERIARRREKRAKIRRIIILAVAEVFVLAGIFAYAYALRLYSSIQRPDVALERVLNTELSEEKIKEMEGYRNIAVFGVDSRDSSVGKGYNSDVIMIVSINQGTGEIRLVSVFRDTYLNTGYDKYNKINNAYAAGGPEQALRALNKNLDLNISEYVVFNWKAVATGLNILGGVDVELSKAEFHYINSYITETVKGTGIGSVQLKKAGLNHLDGVQAVAYARLRYMDSDFARTERQRKVIELAFAKAKKADIATLNSLLGNMLSMVATNLTWQDGLDMIGDIKKYHIGETGGFPFARGGATIGAKGSCVIPQTLETNVRDLHKFLFGDEEYQVSQTVKNISAKVSGDSGMYNEGKYIDHVSTEGGYIIKATESAKDKDETKETEAETTAGETKESFPLYETDEYGETIWLYETDEDGNVLDPPEGYESLPESTKEGRDGPYAPDDTSESGQPGIKHAETKPTSPGPSAEDEQPSGTKPAETKASDNKKPEESPSASGGSQGGGVSEGPTAPAETSQPKPAPGAPEQGAGPGSGDIPTVDAKPE